MFGLLLLATSSAVHPGAARPFADGPGFPSRRPFALGAARVRGARRIARPIVLNARARQPSSDRMSFDEGDATPPSAPYLSDSYNDASSSADAEFAFPQTRRFPQTRHHPVMSGMARPFSRKSFSATGDALDGTDNTGSSNDEVRSTDVVGFTLPFAPGPDQTVVIRRGPRRRSTHTPLIDDAFSAASSGTDITTPVASQASVLSDDVMLRNIAQFRRDHGMAPFPSWLRSAGRTRSVELSDHPSVLGLGTVLPRVLVFLERSEHAIAVLGVCNTGSGGWIEFVQKGAEMSARACREQRECRARRIRRVRPASRYAAIEEAYIIEQTLHRHDGNTERPGVDLVSATDIASGNAVAIRICARDGALPIRSLDLQLWRQFDHPNLPRLLHEIQTPDYTFLVTELGVEGDLFQYIASARAAAGHVAEPQAQSFFRQISGALEYMHSVNVGHADLKPERVLLCNGGRSIKLLPSKLGIAFTPTADLQTQRGGTPGYMAPEIIRLAGGATYSIRQADVWSLGCTLYCLLVGYAPFGGTDVGQILQRSSRAKFNTEGAYQDLSYEAKDLISKILVRNVDRRYGMDNIKQHGWFYTYSNEE